MGAQAPKRGEELGVPRVLEKPAFGALETLAVHGTLAELVGVPCGGNGDAGMDPVFRLDAAPAALERALVGRRAPEQLDHGLHLVFLREGGRDRVALAELGR